MINWQTAEATEPPVTKAIPKTQIKEFIQMGNKPNKLASLFPCNTQGA